METKIINQYDENFEDKIREAAESIKDGKLVAFPTETVYGLGANAFDNSACKNIYKAKGRPSDNPLIVHVSSIKMAETLMSENNEIFYQLANKFWPGPISFIVKKSNLVCSVVSAGLETVAIRMPKHEVALKLIDEANLPIAAPSANISGRPSPTRTEHVIFDLTGKVDYIISSDDFPIGVESTVLDISGEVPAILRPGAISKKMLEDELGIEIISCLELDEKNVPKAPGMKYKHYSPEAEIFIVDEDFVKEDVKKFASENNYSEDDVIFIEYVDDVEMAKNLFADFREADKNLYKAILIKPAKEGDLLDANLNRLKKACGGNLIK